MKALYKKYTNPLSLTQLEIPKIAAGEVLIKVLMSGICRTDQYVAEGTIQERDSLIIGHEFCGRVFESKSDKFKEGQLVTVNPLFKDLSFLGINHDGCFSEFVKISEDQVFEVPFSNLKLAAYVEPIAASLAPLKSRFIKKEGLKMGIYGNNRIAHLTNKILKEQGFKFEIIDSSESHEENSFDVILETVTNEQSIEHISKLLKIGGAFLMKSRYPKKTPVNLYDFVKKEIVIEGLYYHDFNFAIEYAKNNESLFEDLFGKSYPLEQWEEAFAENLKGQKKIFLEP